MKASVVDKDSSLAIFRIKKKVGDFSSLPIEI